MFLAHQHRQPLGVQAVYVPRPWGSPNSQRASPLAQHVTVTVSQGFCEHRRKPRIERSRSHAERRQGSRPRSLTSCLLVNTSLTAPPSQILPHQTRALLQAAPGGCSLTAVISARVRPSSSKGLPWCPHQSNKPTSSQGRFKRNTSHMQDFPEVFNTHLLPTAADLPNFYPPKQFHLVICKWGSMITINSPKLRWS